LNLKGAPLQSNGTPFKSFYYLEIFKFALVIFNFKTSSDKTLIITALKYFKIIKFNF